MRKSTSDYFQALFGSKDEQHPIALPYTQIITSNSFLGISSEADSIKTNKRRYKKLTHADKQGKTAGRWTKEEHHLFLQGTIFIN